MKTAVITGLRGQDGSYLAEQLITEGYRVYGLIRRASQGLDLGCTKGLDGNPNLEVVEGDLLDLPGLCRLCKLAKPDLFLNMASQSHVGSSFEQPVYTTQVTGQGVLHCLEAIRLSGVHTRFLQASTSELYGGMTPGPNGENTPFHPRSPYGCAKLYGYWITVNYRESYKMFACNAICHNHECFFSDTPVIIRRGKEIDVVYVSSLVPNRKDISHDSSQHTKEYEGQGIEVWDGKAFVELRAVSRRKLSSLEERNQRRRITNAPGGSVSTTPNHRFLTPEGEKLPATNFIEASKMMLGQMPSPSALVKVCSSSFAHFLGLLCGDGHVSRGNVRLTNSCTEIREKFVALAESLYCGIGSRFSTYTSGYGGTTKHVDLSGLSTAQVQALREMIYDTKTGHKKVPQVILNGSREAQLSFLKGYNQADGLKRGGEAYEFASFKTNSPLLAQGLLFLHSNTTRQGFNVNTFEQRGRLYIQINLHSPDNPHAFGSNFKKDPHVVKKVMYRDEDNQHVFDIETATGRVMAGVGRMIVANSERRGPNFVTRKISQAAARIKCGLQEKLYLGNLEARRDWGYAPDFTRGMIMMLKDSPEPQDYVLATGEAHSVKDFCKAAFGHLGLDWGKHVEVDPRFYRPAEVHVLTGDYSKIKKDLGWEPWVKFNELVIKMVEHDYQLLKDQ